tara:strand:+ start:3269 stop:4165 length:897 start_codon:yes stop_codon:yes gene_type:complete
VNDHADTLRDTPANMPDEDGLPTMSPQAMLQMLNHFQRLNLSTHLGLGLAHQINHPLSASVNYTQACIKMLQDDNFNRSEILDYMTRANQEVHRAAELIRRLRRFVSHSAPRLSTMNFNHAVLESVALLNPLLKEHRIDLQLELCDDLPLFIGDRIQIEQVIFNVLINAIECLTDGDFVDPVIVLTTHLGHEPDTLALQVKDNGPGIDADMHDHIFEPFQTTRTHCLGIGLAMSQSICRMHGGKISVENDQEGGVVAQLVLPVNPPSQPFEATNSSDNELVTDATSDRVSESGRSVFS